MPGLYSIWYRYSVGERRRQALLHSTTRTQCTFSLKTYSEEPYQGRKKKIFGEHYRGETLLHFSTAIYDTILGAILSNAKKNKLLMSL